MRALRRGRAAAALALLLAASASASASETFVLRRAIGGIGGATGGGESGGGPPAPVTVTFRHGAGGYAGGRDMQISGNGSERSISYGAITSFGFDTSGPIQGLIAFDGMFGAGAGQIPPGATISSAVLTLQQPNPGTHSANVHRMLVAWVETGTWNSTAGGNGIQIDGTDAEGTVIATSGTAPLDIVPATLTLDVTAAVQAWSGGAANHGLHLRAVHRTCCDPGDGVAFSAKEEPVVANRPLLTVTYAAP